jgi:ABC-type transport system involved in cytochrome c biogenesis permease subunit
MHEMSIFWLRVAVGLYSVGLLHAILTVLRREPKLFDLALGCFSVGTLLHMVSLVELWAAIGHLPADNFFESISLCAFVIAVGFLLIYWRYQFSSLGMFLFPLVFLMALVGAIKLPVATWTNARVRDAWLLVHVLLVMLAYAAVVVMSVASVFYLIRERQLKAKTARRLFDRLPPLGTLDNLITQSMGLGFVLLTAATVAGSTWAFIESGTQWITDLKVAVSLFTWALYLLMVFLRTSAGWRGRKAALMALTVVTCSALTWVAKAGFQPDVLP